MTRQAFIVEQPRHSTLRALNYEPAVERLRRTSRGQHVVRLREIVADLGSGYATVFARIPCEPEYGIELLSQSDMFAAEPQGRIIRLDSMQHPERHEVKKWQVLIAGAGTLAPTELYGRAIIADDRLVGKYVGQDSLIIKFKEPGSDASLFAYAYLASATGLKALRASSYGTKILRIRRDILAELPVPQPGEIMIRRVASLVRKSVELREIFFSAVRSAFDTLNQQNEALGDCQALYARGAWLTDIGAQSSSLAARNHRPAAHAFHDGSELGSLMRRGWPRKATRFVRVRCDEHMGVPFFGQRDIFLIRPTPQHVRQPVGVDGLEARRDSIIVAAAGQSGEGTIFGRIGLGDFFAGKLISEHALHLDIDREVIDHRFLFALLHSPWGMAALKSCATGTSVPSLEPRLLVKLRVPRFDSKIEAKIAAHIQRAYAAREEASNAETEAIRIIEEEVLPAWLA